VGNGLGKTVENNHITFIFNVSESLGGGGIAALALLSGVIVVIRGRAKQ